MEKSTSSSHCTLSYVVQSNLITGGKSYIDAIFVTSMTLTLPQCRARFFWKRMASYFVLKASSFRTKFVKLQVEITAYITEAWPVGNGVNCAWLFRTQGLLGQKGSIVRLLCLNSSATMYEDRPQYNSFMSLSSKHSGKDFYFSHFKVYSASVWPCVIRLKASGFYQTGSLAK